MNETATSKRRTTKAELQNLAPRICEVYQQGATQKQISDQLDLSVTLVRNVLNQNGIEIRRTGPSGYSCNHSFFSDFESERTAYWAGFLAADGCITGADGTRISVNIHEKDRSHLQTFLEDLSAAHPIGTSHRPLTTSVYINIHSRQMVSDLAKWNVVPRKTWALQWPEHLNREAKRHYLRGYFDGDGCWHIRANIHKSNGKIYRQAHFDLTSTSGFLEGARKFLAGEVGLPIHKISTFRHSRISTLAYSGWSDVRHIAEFLYGGASIYLERKRAKVAPVIENLSAEEIFSRMKTQSA